MLQVQHLSLEFIGHHVDEDHLTGHGLRKDREGACHSNLTNAHDGHLVARAVDRLGHLNHQVLFERHFLVLFSWKGFERDEGLLDIVAQSKVNVS